MSAELPVAPLSYLVSKYSSAVDVAAPMVKVAVTCVQPEFVTPVN